MSSRNDSAARGRRAGRALAWGLALFALGQAAVSASIAADWWRVRDPLYVGKEKLYEAHRAASRAGGRVPFEILAFGSSRGYFGVRAVELSADLTRDAGRPVGVFNFGTPAAGPLTHRLYLRRVLARFGKPDYLLVEILPPYLACQAGTVMETNWLLPSRLQSVQERDELHAMGYCVAKPDSLKKLAAFAPCYGHRLAIANAAFPWLLPRYMNLDGQVNTDAGGTYAPPKPGPPTAEDRAKGVAIARRTYAPFAAGLSVGGPSARAFRRLLEECREAGVRVGVVAMPEGPSFQAIYGPGDWETAMAFVRRVAADTGADVIDARDWVAEDGFSDGHHLTPEGGRAFSQRLAREALLPLVLRGGRP